jgi:hypothetical protein
MQTTGKIKNQPGIFGLITRARRTLRVIEADNRKFSAHCRAAEDDLIFPILHADDFPSCFTREFLWAF